jgi:SAM-dependent methyltransferase
MTTTFHKTARARRKRSAPAGWIYNNIVFDLDDDTLDYGCGRGTDAAYFGIRGWDINGEYEPLERYDTFKTILCSYVLNVIPSEKERMQVISHIQKLLTPEGNAYLTVRNDKKNLNGWTKSGTYQTFVDLPLPIVHKTSGYIIYRLESWFNLDKPQEYMDEVRN